MFYRSLRLAHLEGSQNHVKDLSTNRVARAVTRRNNVRRSRLIVHQCPLPEVVPGLQVDVLDLDARSSSVLVCVTGGAFHHAADDGALLL